MYAYQEERICKKGVQEYRPANPAASPSTPTQDFCHNKGGNDADEFVSRIGDQVQQLALVADTQDIHGNIQTHELQRHKPDCGREYGAEKLWSKRSSHPSKKCGEEDVGDERHDRDVHIWRIDVVSRRKEESA